MNYKNYPHHIPRNRLSIHVLTFISVHFQDLDSKEMALNRMGKILNMTRKHILS